MTKPSIKLLVLLLMAGVAVGQTALPKICGTNHDQQCVAGGNPTIFGNFTVTKDFKQAVSVDSPTGRIVKLSDEEFARLQKLRQAVVDAETEIAKAHGVYIEGEHCSLNTSDRKGPCSAYPEFKQMGAPPDKYQFRGQFLLINVPKEPLHEPK